MDSTVLQGRCYAASASSFCFSLAPVLRWSALIRHPSSIWSQRYRYLGLQDKPFIVVTSMLEFCTSSHSLRLAYIIGWASQSSSTFHSSANSAARSLTDSISGFASLACCYCQVTPASSKSLGPVRMVLELVCNRPTFPLNFAFIVYRHFHPWRANLPVDLRQAESGGGQFFTEYSGMQFAFFFIAEYADDSCLSCIAAILFLGGWECARSVPALPWFTGKPWRGFSGIFWFAVKIYYIFLAAESATRLRCVDDAIWMEGNVTTVRWQIYCSLRLPHVQCEGGTG